MRILLTVLSSLMLGAILGAPARAAEPEISLTLSAARDGVKAGAEVRLNVLLTNLTEHRIEIESFPRTDLEYRFDVRDSQGHKVPLTRYGRALNGTPDKGDEREDCGDCSNFSPDLGPHEKITDEIVISKIYDLSKPGKYTILASRIHQQTRDAEFVIRSNMITVTIVE